MAWLPGTNVWIQILKKPGGPLDTREFSRVSGLNVEDWDAQA